ncbi:MAG: hypothetical protein ABI651_01315 [Verrucomicrobiota bacterium]
MNKLLKEKRDRIIAVAIATVIAIVGIWYGLIRSQQAKLEDSARTTIKAQEKVTNAKRRVEKEKPIRIELDAARQGLKAIEDKMASGDLYSWIIVTINKFRAAHRVEIPQISREQVSEVNVIPGFPYKGATVTVRGTAYYQDLGKFIADFENTFPHVRLLNLEMEPIGLPSSTAQSNPEEQEKLSFKMDIVTLIKPTT